MRPIVSQLRIADARLHLFEVVTGAESASGPGQQHDGDFGVVGGADQCFGGGFVQRLVERVERLGPVQGERAHPMVVVDLEYHGRLLSCGKVFSARSDWSARCRYSRWRRK